MADPIDPKNADKRTAARYITMGLLDEKAYEKLQKTLPDSAEKSLPVDTVMEDFDDVDEEDETEGETPEA
jgi:microcystin degradation protein MlrC